MKNWIPQELQDLVVDHLVAAIVIAVCLLVIHLFLAFKSRKTLVFLFLAEVFFGYLVFFERYQTTTKEKKSVADLVLVLDREDFDTISIKNEGGKIELKRRGPDRWTLEEPVKDLADQSVIHEIFTAAERFHADYSFNLDPKVSKDHLKKYGLIDSNTKVKLSGPNKTVELVLGMETTSEGKFYVYVEGDSRVCVVSGPVKDAIFFHKADELRDHRLTATMADQLVKAEIKGAVGEIELARDNGRWSIVRPLKARGQDKAIQDFLSAAVSARILQFMPDSDLANYGGEGPRGTLTLMEQGGAAPVVLQFGGVAKQAPGAIYVKSSSRDAVLVVVADTSAILSATPNDLRDRNLLRLEKAIVDRIAVESTDGEKFVFVRQALVSKEDLPPPRQDAEDKATAEEELPPADPAENSAWTRRGDGRDEPISSAVPNGLLTRFPQIEIVDFKSDAAVDLAEYGLDQPSAKVTYSSYSSENTAETTAGDRPLAVVLLGKTEGDLVYAKVEDEPSIVAIPARALTLIPKTATELKDPQIFNFPPEDLISLEFRGEDAPAVALEREKGGQWKVAGVDKPVKQEVVQSLAHTVAHLRAFRWAGPTTPAHGLEKPTLELDYTATQDEKKVLGKLRIGAAASDGLWYAAADGVPGTFYLDVETVRTLSLPLLKPDKPPAPTAAPTPAATPEPKPAASPTPTPAVTIKPLDLATPTPERKPAPTPVPEAVPIGTPTPMPSLLPATPAPTPEAAKPVPANPL